MRLPLSCSLAVIPLLLVVSACSPSGADSEPLPSSSNSSPGPTGSTGDVVAWGPLSMTLPDGFTPVEAPSATGVQRFGANATVAEHDRPAVLAAVVYDAPAKRARAEAVDGAKLAQNTPGEKATSVNTRQVQLPGADDVWTLEYDTTTATGVSLHSSSVIADVGTRTVTILAQAPTTEYADSGLATALTSARFSS